MVQDNKNIFQKAWESGPVQGFFNYPEYLRDEGIQRVMEANEAFNEKGFLGGLGHVSREYASDIVGLPTAITGLPNDLAEWLDPSTETQIGSMVESAYENHRQTYGKDPSMAEKYDIMQNVQNQVSPWLTETVPIAGMDVTKRGLIGLPVAGAAFAAEVAVTGGTAAIAKGLAKKGVRESVEKAPQTLAKQFAEGTKDVARETTRQALLIPKRIDDVVASTLKYTVGKPLQYSAKLTLAGGKKGFDISKAGLYAIPGGKYAADVLWSRATGKAAERNLASEKSTREKFREAGKRQFGTEWKDDWSNIEDDLDDMFLAEAGGGVYEGARRPEGVPRISGDIFGPDPNYEEAYVKRSWWDMLKGVWRGLPGESHGEAIMKAIKSKDAELEEIIQTMSQRDYNLWIAFMRMLETEEYFGKTIKQNKGTKGKGKAEYAQQTGEGFTLTDEELQRLGLRSRDVTFQKEIEVDEQYYNEMIASGKSRTVRVDGKKYFTNPRNLNGGGPGVGDVIQNFDKYEAALKALKVNIDDKVLDRWGALDESINAKAILLGDNGGRKLKGEELSAYDIMGAMRNIWQKYENQAIRDGAAGAGLGLATTYAKTADGYLVQGKGGANVARKIVIEEADRTDEARSYWLTEAPEERTIPSEALLIHRGYRLANPAEALLDRANFIGNSWKTAKQREFVKRMSNALGLKHGTLEELVGPKIFDDINKSYLRIRNIFNGIPTKAARLIANELNEITNEQNFARLVKTGDDSATNTIRKEMVRLEKVTGTTNAKIRNAMKGKNWTAAQRKEVNFLLKRAEQQIGKIFKEAGDGVEIIKGLQKPTGQTSAGFFEDYYFPEELHNALTKGINDLYKINSEQRQNALSIANNLSRTFSATGDFSAVAIQGLLPLLNDLKLRANKAGVKGLGVLSQGDTFNAIGDMFKSFLRDGERVAGEFFLRADTFARLNGLGTVDDAIQSGVKILGNAPDQFVNARQWGALNRIPSLRNFDRSFTHFGNVMRYQVWNLEMQIRALEKGMTVRQLIDSGDAAQIANIVNKMTGVGKRGYGGNLGEFLLFAPRFFKGRLDTLGNALGGTLKGQDASLQQAIARKYMMTMLGMGTTLTVGINTMMGEETDFQPWKQNEATGEWYFNPNFMRTHIGELDISFFGTWDTLFRLIQTPAMLYVNQLNDDKLFDSNQMLADLRSIVSGPLLSKSWDLITGEDGIGQRTRSVLKTDEDTGMITEENWFTSWNSTKQVGETLIEGFIPFAWDDVAFDSPGKPSVVKRAKNGLVQGFFGKEGDRMEGFQEAGTAGAQFVGQFFGVKSSYETLSEVMDEAEAGILELGASDVRLQEAFGMNEKELGIYLAQHGKEVWDNGTLNISSLRGILAGERTPDFSDIAKDYQKNIQSMQEEGRFPEFFTPQQWEEVQKQYNDKLYGNRSEYSMYTIKRDSLMDQEQTELANLENAFKQGKIYENPITGEKIDTGKMQDMSTYYNMTRKIRSNYAQTRRNLTDPINGEFRNLDELFKFGRNTALGSVSSADADIYDYGQASYYEKVWGEDGAIMADGEVNWEKREIIISRWAEDMKEKYPSLTEADIASYLLRIEKKAKADAPPMQRAMTEMTTYIQEAGYYDIERNTFYDLIDRMNIQGPERQNLITQYARWKIQTPQDKKTLEETVPILREVTRIATEKKKIFRANNSRVDAMLRIVGSSKSKVALSNWGMFVDNVMNANRRKPIPEEKMLSFLYDLLNEEVGYSKSYNKFYELNNEGNI